jgi:hypothetical protein
LLLTRYRRVPRSGLWVPGELSSDMKLWAQLWAAWTCGLWWMSLLATGDIGNY